MRFDPRPLQMYGTPSEAPPLEWTWVEQQLSDAGTYWLTCRSHRHPHPRPVWGVWLQDALLLSIGSTVIRRQLELDPRLTVHLPSGTDVVIVETTVDGAVADPDIIGRYDQKYDWHYDVDEYGPLTRAVPSSVMAWRCAGPAGRDGFQQTGAWRV